MTAIEQIGDIFVDGIYETEEDAGGNLRQLHYISGGDGLFAIYVIDQDGKATMNYIHKDYQGSFETITNNQGTVVEKLSYDPWGRRRNPTNWTFTDVPESFKFDHGYTGHEHLDQFGLINMNGRMYDPMLGRFLSPDNYVQAPDYTQNFNRYSYVLNNPLKYTDPSGEWFFVVPNIGLSKEGGFSLGVSVGVGFPGGLSVQAGAGYNFKSSDAYVYVGASAAFNTIYATYSSRSGASVGYTVGLTQFSGFPISTNFVTAGFNYNISHNSWSANISAMQVDQSGWTFNPSVSVMVYPEHTTNLVRGQGFRSNDAVLSRFVGAGNHQGALDYFGFEGKYNPDLKSKRYQSEDYWGATNSKTGEISYGNLAFEDYSTLYGIHIKESYHAQKIQNGLSLEKLPSDLQGLGMDTYLEEIHGYVYAYKRQGLFSGHNVPFSGVGFYQSQLSMFGVSYPTYPSHFSWIYKVPRRW